MITSAILLFVLLANKEKLLDAYIKMIILWTGYLYFLTEVLSLLSELRRETLISGWFLFNLVLLARVIRKNILKDIKDRIRLKESRICFLGCVLVLLGFAAVILSIYTIPYNWDSMTYHLSRLAYWKQNQSVEHYASNVVRQITSPVLAEFVQLHIYILMNGNDVFLQLVQCFSYLTNAIIIYGLARKLGCRKNVGILSAFLFMTLPIAFAEALTTQVDQFVTLWLLVLAWFILDYVGRKRKFDVINAKIMMDVVYMSAAIAFGYLTKPSIMFAVLCLAVWLLICSVRRKDNMVSILKLLFLSIAVMVVILVPEIGKNICSFHAISDTSAGARQLIGRKNPKYVLINFLKNFSWNTPNVYFPNISIYLSAFLYMFSAKIGVEINAPSISEDGRVFAMNKARDFGHDTAVNPVLFVMLVVCLGVMIPRWHKREKKELAYEYCFASFISFLCFCAVLRWEPYVTRYMLSYFALLCPAIGILLQDLEEWIRDKRYYYLFLGSLIFISLCETAAMLEYHIDMANQVNEGENRIEGYLYWQPSEMYSAYCGASELIKDKGYQKIGLITLEDSYDYPMFKMLEPYVQEVRHIDVDNVTAIYEDPEWQPDCIVLLQKSDAAKMKYHGISYDMVTQFDKYCAVLEH